MSVRAARRERGRKDNSTPQSKGFGVLISHQQEKKITICLQCNSILNVAQRYKLPSKAMMQCSKVDYIRLLWKYLNKRLV